MKTRILAMVIGIAIGAYLGGLFSYQTVYVYTMNQTQIIYSPQIISGMENSTFVSIKVPAVDQEGNGVATILDVQVMPGTGRTLANIDKILFWTDTQNSIRTARSVAENITGINLEEYDLIYTITANASVIEGPSAGAALTIATIAALENRTVNESVMMTGTINHDGSIGPVGEILNKAMAAKSIGAEMFIVPLAQSKQIKYRSEKYCENIGLAQICQVEQIPEKIDVAEEAGIGVAEVGSIEEAIKYFLE